MQERQRPRGSDLQGATRNEGPTAASANGARQLSGFRLGSSNIEFEKSSSQFFNGSLARWGWGESGGRGMMKKKEGSRRGERLNCDGTVSRFAASCARLKAPLQNADLRASLRDSLLNDDPHIRNDYVSRRCVLTHRQAGAARFMIVTLWSKENVLPRRGVWQVMVRIAADTSE